MEKVRRWEDISKERIEEVITRINNIYGRRYCERFYHDIWFVYVKKQYGDEMVKYRIIETKTGFFVKFRGITRMLCKKVRD